MSILRRLLFWILLCFACHFSSVVLLFTFLWPNQSVISPARVDLQCHAKERCDSNYERNSTYDSSLPYILFIIVNFIVVSLAGVFFSVGIGDYETEDRIARYLQYPLALCINTITGKYTMLKFQHNFRKSLI